MPRTSRRRQPSWGSRRAISSSACSPAQGHDRPQDSRGRLRPEEGRAVQAHRGAVRGRAGARRRDRAGQAAHLRGGQGRDQGAPGRRARQPRDAGAAREGRERALGRQDAIRRSATEPEAAVPRDRRDRPRRQRPRRQAGDRARRGRKVAQAAFAGAVGIEAEATDLGDGGYAWVDVLAVTTEKQKPFDAVQAEVKAGAVEQERRKEIAAAAAKLVERLNAGRDLRRARQGDVGAKVEKTRAHHPQHLAAGLAPATPCSRPSRCPRAAPPRRSTSGRQGAHHPARCRCHSRARADRGAGEPA